MAIGFAVVSHNRRQGKNLHTFILNDPMITQQLHQAYLETHYSVNAATTRLVLRIGQRCAGLAEIHAAAGVTCSAYLTAFNPYSRQLETPQNHARQLQLQEQLARKGINTLTGYGQHPSNDWPAEESVLALGLGRDAAAAVGRQWEQNAIVWSGPDAVPQLVLLR